MSCRLTSLALMKDSKEQLAKYIEENNCGDAQLKQNKLEENDLFSILLYCLFLLFQVTEQYLDIVQNILTIDRMILQESQEAANTSARLKCLITSFWHRLKMRLLF